MRIIISPAKTMNVDTDSLEYNQLPIFIKDTEVILNYLKKLNYNELKKIWKCSDSISKYLYDNINYITCIFGEIINGKVKEKGTLAKMARGDMVRYMAENQINHVEDIKKYNRLDYSFFTSVSNLISNFSAYFKYLSTC